MIYIYIYIFIYIYIYRERERERERVFFFCTQCGNISAQRMIGLVRPCTGVLSQYERNNLIALEKGDLPPKVAE